MGKIVVNCDPELEGLIPGYINNRAKDISKIREYLASGNFESIRTLGHSMKGSGGGYGFDHITEIGNRIETAALEQDTAKINLAVKELGEYIERVEVVYS